MRNKRTLVLALIGAGFIAYAFSAGAQPVKPTLDYQSAADLIADMTPDGQLSADPSFRAEYADDADSNPDASIAVASDVNFGSPVGLTNTTNFNGGDWGPQVDYGAGYDPMTGFGDNAQNNSDSNSGEGDMLNLSVYDLSAKIADALRPIELFRPFIYDDKTGKPWRNSQVGNPTIGYGHLLTRAFANANPDYTIGMTEANDLMIAHIEKDIGNLAPYVTRPLTENEWIALGVFAYNNGVGVPGGGKGVLGGSLMGLINSGDDESLEGVWKAYNKMTVTVDGQKKLVQVSGLTNRRNLEWNIWSADSSLVALA